MNIILHSLCANFIFLIVSAAETLKLIPGDHSVIKKDGVTHSISKYYVVPADFKINVAANATGKSHKTLVSANTRYNKNMDGLKIKDTGVLKADDNKLDKFENLYKKKVNNPLIGEADGVAEKKVEGHGNVTTTLVASTLVPDPKELGNLQVAPINNSISINVTNDIINVNNGDKVKIPEPLTEINATVNTASDSDDPSDDTLLNDFSILVYDTVHRNLDSFFGVFKEYVSNITNENKQMIRIEKLFILLNIFTNLFDAVQMNISIDGIIDDITDIVIKSYIKINDKSRNEFPIDGHLTKKTKCNRICYQHLSRFDLDSKDDSISETDGWFGNNNIELKKRSSMTYLPRRDTENMNVWLKLPVSSPGSNLETSTNQLINIKKSEWVNSNHLETERMLLGAPGEYNIISPKVSSNEINIARESNIYDDSNLKLNILDMNKLPWSEGNNAALPRIVKPKTGKSLLWSVDNKGVKNVPWMKEDIEMDYSPWIIEDRKFKHIGPLTIKEKVKHNLISSAGNKIGSIPHALYRPDVSKLTVSSDNVLLEASQTPLTTTVNGVTVKDHINKPYQYTHVLKPAKFVYGPKITKNIVKIKSGKYPRNLEALLKKTDGLSSTYQKAVDSKVMLINNNSPQYYKLKNRPGNYGTPFNTKNYIDLSIQDKEAFINPGSENAYPESPIEVDLEGENITDEPIVEELNENSEILLPNVPLNPYGLPVEETYSDGPYNGPVSTYESQLDLDTENEKISTLIDEINTGAGSVELDQETDYTSFSIPGYNGETAGVNAEVHISNQPYGYTRPSISTNGNRPSVYDYLKQVKTSLVPTYLLFSMENLIRLHNALFKIQQFSDLDIYQVRALANLKKINNILLILAQNWSNGNSRWYEDVFYKVSNRNPLQVYVYNLLRQKWLHEIMLTLFRNNFNPLILSNPRVFSLLGAWRFPNYILKLLETECVHKNCNGQAVEENIENEIADKIGTSGIVEYETKNIVEDYRVQHDDLSPMEVNAGLDANVVINIIKHYLLAKQYIENQENIINRGNKIEMFKQIVLFLKDKGYQGRTIHDLIRKLYDAVFSVEEKGCVKNYKNFVQTAHDTIVAVLRRKF